MESTKVKNTENPTLNKADVIRSAEYRDLWKLMEEINTIMWESYMIKGREFGRTEGYKIMGRLEQWAERHLAPVIVRWVDKKVEQPPKEGEYLTYNKDNDCIKVSYYDGYIWGYYATVRDILTHWAELPLPPSVG